MKNLNLILLCYLFSINSYTQSNKNLIFSNNDLDVFWSDGKLNINYNQKGYNKIDILFADTLQIKSRKLLKKFSKIEFDKLAKEFYNTTYNENENFHKIIYFDTKNEQFIKYKGTYSIEELNENKNKSSSKKEEKWNCCIKVREKDPRLPKKLSFGDSNNIAIFVFINDEYVIGKKIFFDKQNLMQNTNLSSDLHLLKNKFIQTLEPNKTIFSIEFVNDSFIVKEVKDKSNPKLVYFDVPLYYDTIEIESPKTYLGQVTRDEFNSNKEALLQNYESRIVGYDGTQLYYEYSNSEWNDCVRFYYYKSTEIETLPGRKVDSWSFTNNNVKKEDGLYNVIIHNKSDIYTSFYINLKNKTITKINNPIDYDEVKY
jgi:hypothetical protein